GGRAARRRGARRRGHRRAHDRRRARRGLPARGAREGRVQVVRLPPDLRSARGAAHRAQAKRSPGAARAPAEPAMSAEWSDPARRIAEDLDTTLVVEAAAGTGKTTQLVTRMIRLLASGRAELDRVV